MRITKAMRVAVLKANGRKGGKARAANLSADARANQARFAAQSRWAAVREKALAS